jgi:hypothetical protein
MSIVPTEDDLVANPRFETASLKALEVKLWKACLAVCSALVACGLILRFGRLLVKLVVGLIYEYKKKVSFDSKSKSKSFRKRCSENGAQKNYRTSSLWD